MNNVRDLARDEAFKAMADGGYTNVDIAMLVGLSPERVRQILMRARKSGDSPEPLYGYSLTAIMASLRMSDVESMREVARRAACSLPTARIVIAMLGLDDVVWRLFRWRRRTRLRADILAKFHAFVAKHGTPPNSGNITNTALRRQRPFSVDYRRVQWLFGSWHDLMLAAGYQPLRRRNARYVARFAGAA